MEKWRFNSMLSNGKFEYRYGLSQSIDRFGPIEDTRGSEDRGLGDTEILSSSDSSSYSNAEHLVDIMDMISFLVRDTNRSIYSLYLGIKNRIFAIDNDLSSLLSGLERLSEPESTFFRYWNYGYLKNGFQNDDPRSDHSLYNIEYSWNNHINGCIDSYLSSQIGIESSANSGSKGFALMSVRYFRHKTRSPLSRAHQARRLSVHRRGPSTTRRLVAVCRDALSSPA